MTDWPGYIKREDLMAFCRIKADELRTENYKVWNAMQQQGISDEDYESLFSKHCSNIGEILGLRLVSQWCLQHKKTELELQSGVNG